MATSGEIHGRLRGGFHGHRHECRAWSADRMSTPRSNGSAVPSGRDTLTVGLTVGYDERGPIYEVVVRVIPHGDTCGP